MSQFWNRCLEELKSSVPQEVFQNWFAELIVEDDSSLEVDSLTIAAPSSAKARTVQQSYGKKISDIVNRLANKEIELLWTVKETTFPKSAGITSDTTPAQIDITQQTGLLPNLTLNNIVAGKANQFAYAAALQVAHSPTAIYNPLFIYGGVGLGKTHLMHAIGHEYLKAHPNAKVRCVSAQQYVQEFMDAIRYKDSQPEIMRQFEARYQGLDLFLIDDIQSFGKRDGTQTNFFLAFESMVPRGKQIVLTSDTFPRSLKDFQERLLSRLTQGLLVEIEPPELDMRVQILLQKADRSGLKMPQDVANSIAKRLKSNVRELEGAVQQILAYTNFHKVPVTMDTVRIALRDIFKASAVPVTVENIQQNVAEYYNLKIADMYSKSRAAPIARARQIAMYLSKELTQKSLPEIGSLFGGRDHTTVLYACKKIAADRSKNEELKHDLNILEQRIKN
jgi:chromosomal replication initiator protein